MLIVVVLVLVIGLGGDNMVTWPRTSEARMQRILLHVLPAQLHRQENSVFWVNIASKEFIASIDHIYHQH